MQLGQNKLPHLRTVRVVLGTHGLLVYSLGMGVIVIKRG